MFQIIFEMKSEKGLLLRAGFEPATYGCLFRVIQLQSTALPTELSKGLHAVARLGRILYRFVWPHPLRQAGWVWCQSIPSTWQIGSKIVATMHYGKSNSTS